MKKNSLIFSALFLVGALAFTSCKNDASVSNSIKGKYNVKVSEINLKDLEDASKQAKEEIEKGKIELHGNLEKAQAELDKEVNIEIDGKKVDLKEALGDMSQGLEKMMDGLGDMSNGLGKGITELVIKNANFQVDFREDGVLAIGSDSNKFNFSSKHLTWEVKDGKLIIKDKEKNNDDFSFELKSKNDKEWELVNDKITFLLNKTK
jgi:uncharacterized protein YlxP (DUF503 family)